MKLRNIFIVSLFVLLFLSCTKDLLEKTPLDRYTDAAVWEDPALIDLFLLSQYAYTPVMVNDATTIFSSWDGGPMIRDPRKNDLYYWFGNSVQTFGPGLPRSEEHTSELQSRGH